MERQKAAERASKLCCLPLIIDKSIENSKEYAITALDSGYLAKRPTLSGKALSSQVSCAATVYVSMGDQSTSSTCAYDN